MVLAILPQHRHQALQDRRMATIIFDRQQAELAYLSIGGGQVVIEIGELVVEGERTLVTHRHHAL